MHIGYLSRAHGLNGEVILKTFDPSSTVLEEVERITLVTRANETKEFAIKIVGELFGSDLLLTLEGIRHRRDADPLVGLVVYVRWEDLDEPEEGEFFHGDLQGARSQVRPDLG